MDKESNLADHGVRKYENEVGVFTSIDPLWEQYRSWTPYQYAGNNPIMALDWNGMNPIYSQEGDFLGTDDTGLQGHSIVMNKKQFKQGMSYDKAMKNNLGIEGLINKDAEDKLLKSFVSLKDRPDWDGYLTLEEANDWYRNGGGKPLYTDLNKINFDGVFSYGDDFIGEESYINLLFGSDNTNDFLVYGNIKLKRYQNDEVRAFADFYNYDMKSWYNPLNWPRNLETMIGQKVAGNGKKYEINLYGSKKLTSIWPW